MRYNGAVTLSPHTLACLARGVELYQAGEFWEAHEAWEEAWQEESGQPRLFLQGLIQLAAALHKALVQRQPASCCKLLVSALGKLEGLPDQLGGQALPALRESMRTALGAAERWSRGELTELEVGLIPKLVGPLR